MGRYAGLVVLLLTALFAVNFASDVLYERAIAAQADEADQTAVVTAGVSEALPLTGLIRIPIGRWGQARMLEASAALSAQSGQARDGKAAPH